MFGCFRKGEAHDPRTFMVGAVGILIQYPEEVINEVTDPVKGLPAHSVFLPSLAEIKLFCDRLAARNAKSAHYGNIPRPARYEPRPYSCEPNTFVSDASPGYAALMERHKETGGKFSMTERRECSWDNTVRNGVWVPLGWYEEANQGSVKPSRQ